MILLNRIEGRSKASLFADKIEGKLKTQTRLPVVRIAQRMAYAKAGAEAKTGAEISTKTPLRKSQSVWKAIQGVMNHDGKISG